LETLTKNNLNELLRELSNYIAAMIPEAHFVLYLLASLLVALFISRSYFDR